MYDTNLTEWAEALTSLETHLDAALGQATDGMTDPWQVPTGLGPIPVELVERASVLLTEQAKAIARFQQFRTLTARHLSAVRTVAEPRRTDTSYYLDMAG
jgi:hypothetical protein